ncbi:MAG: YaaR family protein [Selenomonadaceae bacterium]|nr:YaaR family protein [Selenomonadaceae bacterium]
MAMKVDGFSAQRPAATLSHGRVGRADTADTSFSMELAGQERHMSKEELEELLKKIDEQGARLSATPTYDELVAYRSLVQTFVSEAVDRMYYLHTDAGWDRLGRQKVFTTVRNVDRELETLAEKIRLGQTNQLDIVASQDAIRGMLVDLYM